MTYEEVRDIIGVRFKWNGFRKSDDLQDDFIAKINVEAIPKSTCTYTVWGTSDRAILVGFDWNGQVTFADFVSATIRDKVIHWLHLP